MQIARDGILRAGPMIQLGAVIEAAASLKDFAAKK
jgi:hypothetical protein